MRVTKIDINKTEMDVEPAPQYNFVHVPGFSFRYNLDELPPVDSVTDAISTYVPVQVFNPFHRDPEFRSVNFLIKVDEQKMFQELLTVHKSMLDIKILEATLETEQRTKASTERETIAKIKLLPWWKRIANKF